VAPCQARFGLALTRPASFAVERRRGWTETADTPPRAASDMWDEGRAQITLEKPRPGARDTRLRVRGHYAAFRAAAPGQVVYEVTEADAMTTLEDVHWDADGRLLVATREGRLEIRDGARPTLATAPHAELAALAPEPAPAPAEAHAW
jgi:hypothetical protein